jgi:hypothetical protein
VIIRGRNGLEIGQITASLLSLTIYDPGREVVKRCHFVKIVVIFERVLRLKFGKAGGHLAGHNGKIEWEIRACSRARGKQAHRSHEFLSSRHLLQPL